MWHSRSLSSSVSVDHGATAPFWAQPFNLVAAFETSASVSTHIGPVRDSRRYRPLLCIGRLLPLVYIITRSVQNSIKSLFFIDGYPLFNKRFFLQLQEDFLEESPF